MTLDAIKRFVVVSHPRSGSTWLAANILNHDRALMLGEIFNDDAIARSDAIKDAFRAKCKSAKTPPIIDHDLDAADVISTVFDTAIGSGCSAVGFKLQYEQAWGAPHWSKIWRLIIQRPDISIIHLERTDLLRSYASRLLAFHMDAWHALPGDNHRERAGQRIYINIDSFAGFVRQCFRVQKVISHVTGKQILHLNYENNVVARPQDTMDSVCHFLGIERRPYSNPVVKQREFSLEEVIVNFDKAMSCWHELARRGQ